MKKFFAVHFAVLSLCFSFLSATIPQAQAEEDEICQTAVACCLGLNPCAGGIYLLAAFPCAGSWQTALGGFLLLPGTIYTCVFGISLWRLAIQPPARAQEPNRELPPPLIAIQNDPVPEVGPHLENKAYFPDFEADSQATSPTESKASSQTDCQAHSQITPPVNVQVLLPQHEEENKGPPVYGEEPPSPPHYSQIQHHPIQPLPAAGPPLYESYPIFK